MDDYSADTPFWGPVDGSPTPMVVVPYALDSDDMKMWVAPAHTPAMWLQYACDTFDLLLSNLLLSEGRGSNARGPRMMSIGLHLRIIGRPGRIGAFHRFLQHVPQIGGAASGSRRGARLPSTARPTCRRPFRDSSRPLRRVGGEQIR